MKIIDDCNFKPTKMTSAPNNNHENDDASAADETPRRLCDFCNESKAILYCRADSAKLCFTCDREVHSTNTLFRKHTRCLLCNSCDSSPASIFCCTESAVLCQNCDWESHKSFKSVHDRRPVEGFNGCPSVGELASILGFEDLGKKSLDFGYGNDEEISDLLVWETPSIVSLDDLVIPRHCHNFQVMGVPPLPKNRNAVCGKHKEEILWQLREMAKTEPEFSGSLEDFEPNVKLQSQVPGKCQLKESSPGFENKPEPASVPTYETSTHQWCDYTDEGFSPGFLGSFVDMNHIVPDKDFGDCSVIANGAQETQSFDPLDSKPVIPKAVIRELNSQERDSALSRYKEKKKTRRYDKHIRYESRKVQAETRTRIKGRFAKMDG